MQLGPGGLVSPVFVGRDAELATAGELLDRCATGESAVVLVAGEAGVGKSRFAAEVVDRARARGMRTLSGRCIPLGMEGLPYAPVAEALRELARESGGGNLDELLGPARELVAGLVGAGRPDGDGAPVAPAQLLELTLGLVERLAADRPLLLVLEDLHWADRSTLELAAFLAQNLRGMPAALVATYRSDEVDRRHPLRVLLGNWERTRAITRIELGRFGRDEVRAQLAGIVGAQPDPQTLDIVFERSDGNAFLVEEVLSLVRSGDPLGLSPSLRDVLLARVDLLGASAVPVLRLAAVAGQAVPERLLVAVSGLAEPAVLDALREAVDAHLLVVDGTGRGYTFRHALARDAVYEDLLPGERLRLHAAYADALAADPDLLPGGSPAAALAHHAYAALDLPRALHASITAGREAFDGTAPRDALHHYERALLIWPRVPAAARPDGLDQAELLWLAGEAAYVGGDVDRAQALLREALSELPPDGPPERRARMLLRCARAARDLGQPDRANGLLQEALGLLPDRASAVRAEVLAALANLALRGDRIVDAQRYAEAATEAARSAGAVRVEADAQITLGSARATRGDAARGTAALHAGLDLAVATGDTLTALRGHINISDVLETLGRSARAARTAEAGLDLARQSGSLRSAGAYLTGNLAESLMHLGDWDRARALISEGLHGRPEGTFEATLRLIDAELSLRAGDPDSAARAAARTRALLVDPRDEQFRQPLAMIEAELARLAGDHVTARAIVLDAVSNSGGEYFLRYAWPLVWTGLRNEAERVATRSGPGEVDPELAGLAATLPADTAPTIGYRALCRAELSGTGWDEAAGLWRELSWPWPLAYTLLRGAEVEAAAGRREAARSRLQECWTLAAGLGARPLVLAAEQLAEAARIRIEGATAAAAPAGAGTDDPLARFGLTAREREVLLLLAAGRSNPQIAQELFISPKTASVHVSNILAKLGLSGRVQAAGLVHRLGAR